MLPITVGFAGLHEPAQGSLAVTRAQADGVGDTLFKHLYSFGFGNGFGCRQSPSGVWIRSVHQPWGFS